MQVHIWPSRTRFVAASAARLSKAETDKRHKALGQIRENLAVLLDRPVHLYLHVKVKPGWDEDRGVYRDLGLDWVD